jgi:hypothetical protein
LVKSLREARLQRLRERAIADLLRKQSGRKSWTEKEIAVMLGVKVATIRELRRVSKMVNAT